ncbi:hypothetical protein J0H58_09425 [bacterium]|nr:hypothetical protein [bacterium]
MIRFKCQGCGEPLTAPDANAGQTGRCPHCRELFDIPQPRGAGPGRPGVLRLLCPGCDKTLGVPAAAAGMPCDCPACGTKFMVPTDAEPEPAPTPRSRRPARDDDDDNRPRRPVRRQRDEDDDEPVTRGRRVADDDDDDEDERPRRPAARSRRADDEDDDDRPARRSKPKRRRTSGGGLPDWYRGPLGRLAENAVITLLLVAVALASPVLSGGLLAAWGFLLMMGGYIWFLVVSGKEGAAQVILNLFVPFYAIFYAITRWDDVKHPVTVYLIGVAQYTTGVLLLVGPLLAMAQQQK